MENSGCQLKDVFLTKARGDLDAGLQKAVKNIRIACNNKADFAGAPTLSTLSDYGIKIPLSLGEKRIIELEDSSFRMNLRSNAKGIYKPRTR